MIVRTSLAPLLVALLVPGCLAHGDGVDDASSNRGDDALTVCPGASVEGVDVSEYQGDIDWNAVHASGRAFAFIRVSDGTGHFDSTFDRNWSGAKAAGVARGVYQFFRASEDGTAQANLLLAHMGALAAGDLPPVADVEVDDGVGPDTLNLHLSQWNDRIREATGKTPVIYTSPGLWPSLSGSDAFGGDALWVANWDASCPSLPSPWTHFDFWQYADDGGVPGISGAVDLDRFNGSLDDLARYGGGAVAQHRISPIAVAENADGRLEVFAPGADAQLWHQWQTTPGGAWSGFWPLTGNMTGAPAVAKNHDGRLEVFVRGSDGQLWHQWQTTAGGGWSGFWPLGGQITDSPAVAKNHDGRLEVFVRGSDGQLWHQWQTTAGGGWSGFWPLTGNMTDSPAVAANKDGRLEVFVRGSDGQLWHQWQTTAGGGWSGFWPLTGNMSDSPAVGVNEDGRLEVFVRGSDGSLWHQWQITAGGSWSGFASMAGQILGGASVATNEDGRLEVFVRGADSHLWHQWQKTAGGAWSGFTPLTGSLTDVPSVGSNADGRLEVFVRGSDGSLWHDWQTTPGGGWSGFFSLAGQLAP